MPDAVPGKALVPFQGVDLGSGWEQPSFYPPGIEQKPLAGALDETGKRGSRTRLVRFAPGAGTTEPFVHDYWEEVWLVAGSVTIGRGAEAVTLASPAYACHPPGTWHGPFHSQDGCVLLEIHSFGASGKD